MKKKPTFTSSFSSSPSEGDTIRTEADSKGRYFLATIERDDDMGFPWKEHDGHGSVREVGRFEQGDKKPGERILYRGNRGEDTYLYDWAGAIATARKDGWGCGEQDHNHKSTGEKAVCAAQKDFKYLKDYIEGEWFWVGIKIDYMQECEEKDGVIESYVASLWGIGSADPGDYLNQVAEELLDEAVSLMRKKLVRQTAKV